MGSGVVKWGQVASGGFTCVQVESGQVMWSQLDSGGVSLNRVDSLLLIF